MAEIKMVRVIDGRGKARELPEATANNASFMKKYGFKIQHIAKVEAPEVKEAKVPVEPEKVEVPASETNTVTNTEPVTEFATEAPDMFDAPPVLVSERKKPGRKASPKK